jgi:hypothetical protein
MDSSTSKRLLYWIFFYNAILLRLHSEKYLYLIINDFKKRSDRDFDVWIFRSKVNQKVNTNHCKKGKKLILSNNFILINDYDKYIDL